MLLRYCIVSWLVPLLIVTANMHAHARGSAPIHIPSKIIHMCRGKTLYEVELHEAERCGTRSVVEPRLARCTLTQGAVLSNSVRQRRHPSDETPSRIVRIIHEYLTLSQYSSSARSWDDGLVRVEACGQL